MKNQLTTTIDLNVLMAEMEKASGDDGPSGNSRILRLTVEWELESVAPAADAPTDQHDEDRVEASPRAESSAGEPGHRTDDWQSTVSQFPDD